MCCPFPTPKTLVNRRALPSAQPLCRKSQRPPSSRRQTLRTGLGKRRPATPQRQRLGQPRSTPPDPRRSAQPEPRRLRPSSVLKEDPANPIPVRFRVPPNITKFSGHTNPDVWLEDFHLACRAGGADDDLFTIQYLPLYLAESA